MSMRELTSLFNDSPKSSDLKEFFDSFNQAEYDSESLSDLKHSVSDSLTKKLNNTTQTSSELLNFFAKTFICNMQLNKFCIDFKVFDEPAVRTQLDRAAQTCGYMNFAHFFKRALEEFPGFNMTLNDLQLSIRNEKQLFKDTLEKNLYRAALRTHSIKELIESKLSTAFDVSSKLNSDDAASAKVDRLKKVFADVKFVEYLIDNELFITSKLAKTQLYEIFDRAVSEIGGVSNFASLLSEYLDQTQLTRDIQRQEQLKMNIERLRIVEEPAELTSSYTVREYSFLTENANSIFDDAFVDQVVAYDVDRRVKKNLTKTVASIKDSLKSIESHIFEAYEKTKTHVVDLGIDAALAMLRKSDNIFEDSTTFVETPSAKSTKRLRAL